MDKECKECFTCFNHLDGNCLIHPIYPGEQVCKDCHAEISEKFKYMINYKKSVDR